MIKTTPSLFVGSSEEGLEFARAARTLLEDCAEVKLWKEDFVHETVIEELVDRPQLFDFALLVFTPDDFVKSRDAKQLGPRDNVIFEAGLFMGCLGRERTFLLRQRNADLKIPSDLNGLVFKTYNWPRQDNSYQSAVGAACDGIRTAIRSLGVLPAKTNKRVDELENKIEWLFAKTMSKPMFLLLRGLAAGNPAPVPSSPMFRRQLRHLRDLGYISVKGRIGQIPGTGSNLSEYVKVTDAGRRFVEFRERVESMEDR